MDHAGLRFLEAIVVYVVALWVVDRLAFEWDAWKLRKEML